MLALFLILLLGSLVNGSVVPDRYDGFPLGEADAPILVEAYFDLQCPYSRLAYETWRNFTTDPFFKNVRFIIHQFPLPFHHNSFLAAKATNVISQKSQEKAFDWMDIFYANQESFFNAPTANLTVNQVVQNMASLAEKIGFDQETFIEGMTSSNDVESLTRNNWHFGCYHGVNVTPTFSVNGVIDETADSSWTVEDWKAYIQNLLDGSKSS